MSDFIYLDYNATTPVDPRVLEAMLPYLREDYGNPSSGHALGQRARAAVEQARAHLARLLGCEPGEILFSSGGSESNNAVIFGVAEQAEPERHHLITSAVEHPAVVEPCRVLEERGWRITRLSVDGEGLVDPVELERALDGETALVSVMLANNEVGAIEPVAELAALCREAGAPLHTDAAQAVGKMPVDARGLGVDYLTVAGHKLYAPKGVGALFIRTGRELPPFVRGAGQEGGRRAGTENVPEIVGLGEAARIASDELESDMVHSRDLRDRLLAALAERIPADRLRVNGPLASRPELCLPGTLSLSLRGLAASDLLAELRDTLAASAGAACNTEGTKVSAVLAAMDVPLDWARGTLRLSVGRMTTEEEIDRAVAVLADAAARLSA